tara:strand:+ start:253 stop:645 length:393 start_codon:yes stop_codon:yes gene_type:complete
MAKKGLKEWLDEKWVDIGAPKKDGKYQPCGRQKGSKRKYPKCVPLAKATRMTSSQKASAVRRKRAAGNPGGKPTNVATFTKRNKKANGGSVGNSMIKQAQRDYKGTYISGDLGGVKVSNPSYKKYYKGMI